MSGTRTTTLAGRLARMGFADAARAERLVTSELALDVSQGGRPGSGAPAGAAGRDDAVLEAIGAAADPDLALASLARIAGTDRGADAADIRAALRAEPGFRKRLIAVLGVSVGLADHLARHPHDAHLLRGADSVRRPTVVQLRAALLHAVEASPLDDTPVADLAALDGTDPAAALAAAYKRRILHLAARDLTGVADLEEVAAELADIATAALDAALAVARAELPPNAHPVRLAVVAMGKCGGRELNYASDVDVIFVAAPAEGTAPTGTTPRQRRRRRRRRDRGAADRHPARQRADQDLLADHAGRHDLPRRPEPPPGGPQRPAGAHAGQPHRLLRALGQDVGVPGAAQGPASRGRHRARAAVRGRARPDGLARGAAGSLRRGRAGHAAPGGEDPAGGPGWPGDQAGPGRPARHRVRRAAPPARARPHGRVAAQPGHAPGPGRAGRGRLRRTRRCRRPRRRVPVPAAGRAPAAAVPAAAHPCPAGRPGRSAQARPGDGGTRWAERASPRWQPAERGSVRRVHRNVAAARPPGATAAREAVLPAAAGRGGPAGRRRDPPDAVRGGGPPRGARLRGSGRRAPPHPGPDRRGRPARGDSADAASGAARLVRRRGRAGRRFARLPPGQRRTGGIAVVPAAAPGRDQGRRAAGPRARLQPVRDRPAAPGAGGGGHPRG